MVGDGQLALQRVDLRLLLDEQTLVLAGPRMGEIPLSSGLAEQLVLSLDDSGLLGANTELLLFDALELRLGPGQVSDEPEALVIGEDADAAYPEHAFAPS
jgi:hypothetical protein